MPAIRIGAGRRARSVRSHACAALCAAALALAPVSALAESDALDMAKEAGIGSASALASLIYAPIKLTYATLGVVVGGLAYAFSGGDTQVAKVVLTPSVRGDYVLTPGHITGRDHFDFFGREPAYREEERSVAATEGGDAADPAAVDWSEGW
jgi:hypothetical protein